jgi:hypothetical protein
MKDVSSGEGRLKVVWEVRAGVIPGTPMPEVGKRWYLTAETWHREQFKKEFPDSRSPSQTNTFVQYRDEAYEYAKSLNDPHSFNWVEVTWIWY